MATKQALIAAAAETIAPIETEKFGAGAPFHVADSNQLDVIIVDRDADVSHLAKCRAVGLEVVTAD